MWCILTHIEGDTKKRELLKCVVAAMYRWQHCGTGTLSYRQPRHLVKMGKWNGQQRAFAIKVFLVFLGFQKFPFFCVTYINARYSYSCKEVLQNTNYCLINQKHHWMQWLDLWGIRYPVWKICNYSLVGCDVIHVFGRSDQR